MNRVVGSARAIAAGAAAIAAGVGGTLAIAEPAMATPPSHAGDAGFEQMPYQIGCGLSIYGGTVRGTQTMLWASGYYGTPSFSNINQVDGIWGSASVTALKAYQTNHQSDASFGTTNPDGCAGYVTWNNFKGHTLTPSGIVPGRPYMIRQRWRDTVENPGQITTKMIQHDDPNRRGCWWFQTGNNAKTWSREFMNDDLCWYTTRNSDNTFTENSYSAALSPTDF